MRVGFSGRHFGFPDDHHGLFNTKDMGEIFCVGVTEGHFLLLSLSICFGKAMVVVRELAGCGTTTIVIRLQ